MRSTVSVFAFLALFTAAAVSATPAEDIAAVRQRAFSGDGNVSESDKAVIDKFLRVSLDAFFLNEDSAQLAEVRRQILAQKGDQDLSMYASTYLGVIRDHLRTAFDAAERLPDPQRKQLVTRNLVILAAELRSLLLAEFGIEHLQSPDVLTRYWAVKSIADTSSTLPPPDDNSIVGQLNNEVTNIPESATKIYEALMGLVKADNPPQIQVLLINFAGQWKDERAVAMVSEITNRRISAYRDWSVKNTWLEIPLLRALAAKHPTRQLQAEKAEIAKLFAQLYSMVVQRWMLGQETLSPVEKKDLLSVIVEVDQEVFGTLGVPTGRIKSILERGGDLQREFDDLFGTATRAGDLGNRLRFTYGQNGQSTTAPPKLGPPPAAEVTKAPEEAAGG